MLENMKAAELNDDEMCGSNAKIHTVEDESQLSSPTSIFEFVHDEEFVEFLSKLNEWERGFIAPSRTCKRSLPASFGNHMSIEETSACGCISAGPTRIHREIALSPSGIPTNIVTASTAVTAITSANETNIIPDDSGTQGRPDPTKRKPNLSPNKSTEMIPKRQRSLISILLDIAVTETSQQEGSSTRSVNAVSSSSPSAIAVVAAESHGHIFREVQCRNPNDLNLADVPVQMFHAFNGGNLMVIRNIIAKHFEDNCTFQTMIMTEPKIGRNFVYSYLNEISSGRPDSIFVVKKNRVVVDSLGRCLKWACYASGTNVEPGRKETFVLNSIPDADKKFNEIISHLDTTYLTSEDIEEATKVVHDICYRQQPYSVVARLLYRCGLSDDDKITSFTFHWRYLTFRRVDLSMYSGMIDDDDL